MGGSTWKEIGIWSESRTYMRGIACAGRQVGLIMIWGQGSEIWRCTFRLLVGMEWRGVLGRPRRRGLCCRRLVSVMGSFVTQTKNVLRWWGHQVICRKRQRILLLQISCFRRSNTRSNLAVYILFWPSLASSLPSFSRWYSWCVSAVVAWSGWVCFRKSKRWHHPNAMMKQRIKRSYAHLRSSVAQTRKKDQWIWAT